MSANKARSVLVAGGTLLPLARPVVRIDPDAVLDVVVRASGPQPRPFSRIEDDGITFDFERGRQGRMVLRWDGKAGAAGRTGRRPPDSVPRPGRYG